jgi:FkbM family methyltransferase
MSTLRRATRHALAKRGYAVSRMPPSLCDNSAAILRLSFDHVLSHFLLRHPTIPYFLQVGAFDGVSGDPLYPYVKRGLLKGCLVEPQSDAYERLQANYHGIEGVCFRRAAIGPKAGDRILYRVRPGTVGPEWLFQIASFSREVLLKHATAVPGLEQAIITEIVPTITFDELLVELPVVPNVVVIDTEGYDFEIIKLLNAAFHKPNVILYEHKHLVAADQNACVELLIAAGYQLSLAGNDTVAYLLDEHA